MDGRQGRWWLWALAGLVALAALAAIILILPSLMYGDVSNASPDARLQAASGFRTAVVAGLAGLAALGSLAMANRTYRLTQQGQITERYTKAIEQLGSGKLDVRLGGIYALERIATDSERDHPTVVEVLSAFVREHSQPSTDDDDNVGDDNGGPHASPPEPVTKPFTSKLTLWSGSGRVRPCARTTAANWITRPWSSCACAQFARWNRALIPRTSPRRWG
jgi:membrane protein implicated in regulation of membrane protease activity